MFDENDIRPKNLKVSQKDSIDADINFLLQREDRFIEVNCPTCNTYNNKVEMKKNGFTYVECKNCTMLYIALRPTEEVLSEFYPQSKQYEYFNKYIFPQSAQARREKIFAPRVDKVLELCDKYNIDKDAVLEVGSGYGFFLEEMTSRKAFKSVIGTEASDSLYETALEKEYTVYNGILENLEIKEKFDFVVSYEVIEHVFNPKGFLEKIDSLMKKNSMLMISFPNYDGFDMGMLREKIEGIDHEHLNYFNEKSISILLNKVGFDIKEIYTPGSLDVDIVKSALNDGRIKNSFLRNLCADENKEVAKKFQQFLHDNKLSSHMIVIAKKV